MLSDLGSTQKHVRVGKPGTLDAVLKALAMRSFSLRCYVHRLHVDGGLICPEALPRIYGYAVYLGFATCSGLMLVAVCTPGRLDHDDFHLALGCRCLSGVSTCSAPVRPVTARGKEHTYTAREQTHQDQPWRCRRAPHQDGDWESDARFCCRSSRRRKLDMRSGGRCPTRWRCCDTAWPRRMRLPLMLAGRLAGERIAALRGHRDSDDP
jgi:hypothetical protein